MIFLTLKRKIHNYTGRRKKETFIPFNVQKKFEDILKG
jgi:hypothetical protein